MKAGLLIFIVAILGFGGLLGAADPEPSEFRLFFDKKGQQVEARLLSISDDRRMVKMERRDGGMFETAVTKLRLDDQQFVRDWLSPAVKTGSGSLRVFGVLRDGEPIDTEAASGIDDIESIHAMLNGWLVRRKSGEVVAFVDEWSRFKEVATISANTKWGALTRKNGSVGDLKGRIHFPNQVRTAVQSVAGGNHRAVLLGDGTVKVWGNGYKSGGLLDPPVPLSGIVGLASGQGKINALHRDGRVFSWAVGKPEIHQAMLGDGLVQIEGSIFHCLGLSRSGEVYEWTAINPQRAVLPKVLESEGPFQKVRCNGATRAAQRMDGTWIAWGTNGAGIVDHINSLGPAPDIAFCSEPGRKEHGYVIWIEP